MPVSRSIIFREEVPLDSGNRSTITTTADREFPISVRGWAMTRLTPADARDIAAALTRAADWLDAGAPDDA